MNAVVLVGSRPQLQVGFRPLRTPVIFVTRHAETLTTYREVRAFTEALAAPLSPEDQVVQSMPDVSPTKWHRAHTTWFFETFVLEPALPATTPFDPAYAYLFNSYYEQVGAAAPAAGTGPDLPADRRARSRATAAMSTPRWHDLIIDERRRAFDARRR